MHILGPRRSLVTDCEGLRLHDADSIYHAKTKLPEVA